MVILIVVIALVLIVGLIYILIRNSMVASRNRVPGGTPRPSARKRFSSGCRMIVLSSAVNLTVLFEALSVIAGGARIQIKNAAAESMTPEAPVRALIFCCRPRRRRWQTENGTWQKGLVPVSKIG